MHAPAGGPAPGAQDEWNQLFQNPASACLNCGRPVADHYCGHCGQRLHTHRLSISHFIAHDLVHGLFHVDRGIFHTLLEVTLRPGYAALDYIRGKRTGKFPIVTLLLLLVAALLLLRSYSPWSDAHGLTDMHQSLERSFGKRDVPAGMLGVLDFVTHHFKWFLLALIPVNALTTRAVFRRPRLNWAEHLLLNSYFFAGTLVVAILFNLVLLLAHRPFDLGTGSGGWILSAFYLFAYWQAFRSHYTVAGFLWRAVVEAALSLLLFMVLTVLVLVVAALVMRPA